MEFESILERDAIALFERDVEIISYQEQPEMVFYYDKNHQPRKYYPDFRVEFESGFKFHIEIKPAKKLGNSATLKKYQAVAESYKLRDEIFRILTDEDLRLSAKTSTLDLLNNGWLEGEFK